jgi:hypothetical protein
MQGHQQVRSQPVPDPGRDQWYLDFRWFIPLIQHLMRSGRVGLIAANSLRIRGLGVSCVGKPVWHLRQTHYACSGGIS